MAYVHCHSCDWQQDDFWTFRWKSYNPISFFLRYDIPGYIVPRIVRFDPTPYSLGTQFSWWVLLRYCLWKWIRRMATQKWWTNASWKRAVAKNGGKWPECPKCGNHNLDID